MRNGTVLYSIPIDSSYPYEFLGISVVPSSALISYSGVNGLKFGKYLNFSLQQNVQTIKIRYSGGPYGQKLKFCNLKLAFDLEYKLKDQVQYELAHSEAVTSARKFRKVAPPVLQQRTRETVPPLFPLVQLIRPRFSEPMHTKLLYAARSPTTRVF